MTLWDGASCLSVAPSALAAPIHGTASQAHRITACERAPRRVPFPLALALAPALERDRRGIAHLVGTNRRLNGGQVDGDDGHRRRLNDCAQPVADVAHRARTAVQVGDARHLNGSVHVFERPAVVNHLAQRVCGVSGHCVPLSAVPRLRLWGKRMPDPTLVSNATRSTSRRLDARG